MLLAQKRRLGMFGIIMALALPTILEQLMHTAVQYIDTAMVGVLGTQATAAVGSTSTISWLVGSTTSALGVGFLSYIAKSIGAKKYDDARRASAQAVFVVLTVGTLLTVITLSLSKFVPILMNVDESIRELASKYFFILYLPMLPRTASTIFGMVLRSSGDTKTPMLVGIGVNLTNVIMNFLLIYPTRKIMVFSLEFLVLETIMIGTFERKCFSCQRFCPFRLRCKSCHRKCRFSCAKCYCARWCSPLGSKG